MNFNLICPVCENEDQLNSFKWSNYKVINCNNCGLDYCANMLEKEKGGDSSPVDSKGIEMMSNMFYKTRGMAMLFALKRKKIYESYLNKNCENIL